MKPLADFGSKSLLPWWNEIVSTSKGIARRLACLGIWIGALWVVFGFRPLAFSSLSTNFSLSKGNTPSNPSECLTFLNEPPKGTHPAGSKAGANDSTDSQPLGTLEGCSLPSDRVGHVRTACVTSSSIGGGYPGHET